MKTLKIIITETSNHVCDADSVKSRFGDVMSNEFGAVYSGYAISRCVHCHSFTINEPSDDIVEKVKSFRNDNSNLGIDLIASFSEENPINI